MRQLLAAIVLVLALVFPTWAATQLFSDGFESGNTSAWTECSQSVQTAQKHSGTYAMQYNGTSEFLCIKNISGSLMTEVYVSFWNRWPSVTSGGWNHMWRLRPAGGSSPELDCEWNRANGSFFQCPFLGFGVGYNVTGGDPYASHYGSGQWFRTEMHVIWNTPGQANGTFRYWVNGVAWKDLTSQNMRSSGNVSAIYAISNFDASSNVTAYLDDVEVWNGCPPSGATCSGGAPSPPAAPTDLRVIAGVMLPFLLPIGIILSGAFVMVGVLLWTARSRDVVSCKADGDVDSRFRGDPWPEPPRFRPVDKIEQEAELVGAAAKSANRRQGVHGHD